MRSRWLLSSFLLSCAKTTPPAQPVQQGYEVPAHTQALIDAYRSLSVRRASPSAPPQCPGDERTVQRERYLQTFGGCREEASAGAPSLDVAPRDKWPALYAALDARKEDVAACLGAARWFFELPAVGELVTRVELSATGQIEAVTTPRDDAANDAIACCVRSKLRLARIPAPGRPIALEWSTPLAAVQPPTGRLSEDDVRNVVRAHHEDVRQCYEAHHAPGRLQLRIVIAGDGHVMRAQVEQNATGSSALGCCLMARARDWVFAAPAENDPVIVSYPFDFE
jgi:hypothetical protein